MVVSFGQVVVGSPGAGKTTYCHGMSCYLRALGRQVAIINLDPANDHPPYKADLDLAELVSLQEAMDTYGLGPNGGLVYCMEFLEANLDWLTAKLDAFAGKGLRYYLFDFPGQVELYTHSEVIQRILKALDKWGCRLAAVHLVDAFHCSDAGKFISITLLSLMTMLRLELPHVNVLSKVDLIESYGKLAFNLDFYTDALSLEYLVPFVGSRPYEEEEEEGETEGRNTGGGAEEEAVEPPSRFLQKYRRLNELICEVVQDYGLVAFQTLNIQDGESVARLLAEVDKCNGYLMCAHDKDEVDSELFSQLFHLAFDAVPDDARVRTVQDKYMSSTSTSGGGGGSSDGGGGEEDGVKGRPAVEAGGVTVS